MFIICLRRIIFGTMQLPAHAIKITCRWCFSNWNCSLLQSLHFQFYSVQEWLYISHIH